MKHEDFRKIAVGDAFDVIEGRILPSLTLLIESAAAEIPGDALRAEQLRALAAELELLSALIEQVSRDRTAPRRNSRGRHCRRTR